MNTVATVEHRAVELVDIVDFKWLMAGEGHHIHVERLQNDTAYAAHCLALAAASRNEAVRAVARRLGRQLGLPPVTG